MDVPSVCKMLKTLTRMNMESEKNTKVEYTKESEPVVEHSTEEKPNMWVYLTITEVIERSVC